MKTIVVASTRENAGKTSLIVGLTRAFELNFAYIKPLGDRLLYQKKQLWDYDALLMAEVFDLPIISGSVTIGFDPVRLKNRFVAE